MRTIIIEGNPVRFYYGSSFLMVFVCGISDLLAGKAVLIIYDYDKCHNYFAKIID